MVLRSICWVILFLSRIRFFPGKSLVEIWLNNMYDLLHSLVQKYLIIT